MIFRQPALIAAYLCAGLIMGCRATSEPPQVVDLGAVIENAAKTKQPVVLLIGEFGPSGADRATGDLLGSPAIKAKSDGAELIRMDLAASRNRATAARYHTAVTPVLVCLSPTGLIVSRDQGPITAELLIHRLDGLRLRAADLDAKLMLLRDASTVNKKEKTDESELATFLLGQQNAREAIPYLTDIAAAESMMTADRINAWVAMARAHLWIGEPEKARHEAKDLIATLGPADPQAIAGGNLVLGLQDIAAKRFVLARQEFETAIAAAPDSAYSTSAKEALSQLPKEGK
jgi:hypothetical protein